MQAPSARIAAEEEPPYPLSPLQQSPYQKHPSLSAPQSSPQDPLPVAALFLKAPTICLDFGEDQSAPGQAKSLLGLSEGITKREEREGRECSSVLSEVDGVKPNPNLVSLICVYFALGIRLV
ncbi:hypothetical protein MHYP_G00198450 [Metynnis hypsauchen]